MHMTSLFVHFFLNLNLSSSYEGLLPHQNWLNLGEGKQSYGGGFLHVENVLNRPGEIRLIKNLVCA